MKLATLNNGKRDGALVVVSRDLARAVHVTTIAPTLQSALDQWGEVAPQLAKVYQRLNECACPDAFPFDEEACLSPLPPRRRHARKLLARSPDVSGRL
jgi:fumarylacetoacetate (FAA) hydrolase